MTGRSRWLGLLAAIAMALALVTPGAAVSGPRPQIIVTPSKGTFTCNHWWTVRATLYAANGTPLAGKLIHWNFKRSPSRRDQVLPRNSRTNSSGVAKTKYKFACVRGDRKVRAMWNGVTGTAIIHVKLPRRRSSTFANTSATGAVLGVTSISDPGSLPSTSTVTPAPAASTDTPTNGWPVPVVPALLAVLVGMAIFLRRLALSRR